MCTQSGLSVDLTPSTRRLMAPPRLLALAALRTGARASQIARRAVSTEVLAERAKLAVLDPHRNGVIEALATPRPLLGLFNDIPRHQFRESDARAWAVAGFDFVVNDAEHSGNDLLYGREENACLQRYGLTPIQRLPREAVSAHGDALAGGARGTMRPYALTLDDAQTYVEAADFPVSGAEGLRRHARGAFPVRGGDGAVTFTPETLRDAEQGRTLACLQFETEEYLFDEELRRKVLGVLSKRGNACAFVGALDAATRCGSPDRVADGVADLCADAAGLGVAVGGVVGGASPAEVEANMLRHMKLGMRMIAPPVFASDLALYGALATAEPFHAAAAAFRSN